MSFVYLATNQLDGKRYIGATSKTVDLRRRQHLAQARRGGACCRRFHAAIRKYGPDAFEWVTLVECLTPEDALAHERRLISEIRPEYNLTAGGQGSPSDRRTGHIPSPETIKKRADANRGKIPTLEHREKIRVALKGRKRPPDVVHKMLVSRAKRFPETASRPWLEMGISLATWKRRRNKARESFA